MRASVRQPVTPRGRGGAGAVGAGVPWVRAASEPGRETQLTVTFLDQVLPPRPGSGPSQCLPAVYADGAAGTLNMPPSLAANMMSPASSILPPK